MAQYDVICIGGGHASWPVAATLQKQGLQTLLIANDRLGGTCTSWGCDPKILLDAPFEIMAEAARYRDIGLEGNLKLNWEALQAYNRKVIAPLPGMLQNMIEQSGAQIVFGSARLTSPHTVLVNGKEHHAKKIVIATGRRAATLNIPGAEYIRNSSDFLYTEHFPERIVFIGAGIISLEFASMAVRMAREVVIITNGNTILPQYYDRYSRKLLAQLEAEGVKFHFDQTLSSVVKRDEEYLVKTQSGLEIKTDYVLGASGRIPNVEGLGLEEAGVIFSQRGIPTDEQFRTNVPHIYASGDIRDTSIPRLTPTAFFEAGCIVQHILGEAMPMTYPAVPNVVFTIPRIAQVGISQKEAKNSDAYRSVDIDYGKQMLFQTRNEKEAEVAVVLNKEGYLVGADIYGDFSGELINFLTLVINLKLTARDLRGMIFAFPTHSFGAVKFALENLLRQE
ncbi:dihydrolipoyl dehydrogenase family protein [Swingsia samuiensis]|uniref:NAD(P)/FAD-dependent oxidoreductase n=1 Tax=Swingsia samuiensis TaxID=1293412 RepID=A0A4Y6UGN5_9PROT|nr:NAD(P)/FAD-dependent oxidoreductase [Swingsia samuiensis]QDH16729.1 NAD(P)/FAD-dependent oxidoreductase [Swingsia samuiensis]